jgi:transglutaminase-like putative cysteine protease
MSPAKRAPPPKKDKQIISWRGIVLLALIIVSVVAAVHFWPTANNKGSVNNQATSATTDSAFAAFTNQYLDIMKNLNSSQTKAKMLPLLSAGSNQTDLFSWEGGKMTFASDPEGSHVDPFQILDRGEGVCLQWSIVYVSACLALGYQSRLVVAVDTQGWSWIHVWAEDYYNGAWVPVDPSDKAWDMPHVYLNWDWGPYIGTTVKCYAFEDNGYQDVTPTYSAQ